jgi:putative NADPH-quinone reductase
MVTRKPRRILIIDGHPDPRAGRFVHHLARTYARAADEAGHAVRVIRVADLKLPLLRTTDEFRKARPGAVVEAQQAELLWAEHVVILFPLWLGAMPALLKGWFEQVFRPGFAFGESRGRGLPRKLLKGRSARVIVTMGMPSLFYRLVYQAHSLKSLERNILAFVGFGPIRDTVIGNVEAMTDAERAALLADVEALGRKGL